MGQGYRVRVWVRVSVRVAKTARAGQRAAHPANRSILLTSISRLEAAAALAAALAAW